MAKKTAISRRTKILSCVAAILFIICAVQLLLGLRPTQKAFKIKGEPDWISVENAGSALVLEKGDGGWTSGQERLDQAKVERLLKSVSTIRTLGLASRSESAAARERYGLDKAIAVAVKSGQKDARTLLIGKESAGGTAAYVQIDGKKEIYLAQGSLRGDWTIDIDAIKAKEEAAGEESGEPLEAEED